MKRWCTRHRRALLVGLATLIAVLMPSAPLDYYRFAHLADLGLRGHLNAVYATPWNQSGPLQLLIGRAILIGSQFGGNIAWPIIVVLEGGLVWCALRTGGRVDSPGSLQRDLFIGGCAVLWSAVGLPLGGHPAELVIPIGWLVGIELQRQGRSGLAAVALGSTIAVAPWGVLAFPALLGAASLRRAMATGTAAILIGATWYLPFAITGDFALFRHQWQLDTNTMLHALAPHAVNANWLMRIGQAGAVAGGCAVVAWRTRGHRDGVLYALLVAGLLRIIFDPEIFSYYWMSVAVFSIVLLARTVGRRTSFPLLPIAFAYLVWASSTLHRQWIGAVVCLGLVCLLIGQAVSVPGRSPLSTWRLGCAARPAPAESTVMTGASG